MRKSRTGCGWLLALVAVACDGADEGAAVSRRECEQLRDHVVAVRLAAVTADRDDHAAALRAVLGESFVAACVGGSPDEVRCGLGATTADALAACGEVGR